MLSKVNDILKLTHFLTRTHSELYTSDNIKFNIQGLTVNILNELVFIPYYKYDISEEDIIHNVRKRNIYLLKDKKLLINHTLPTIYIDDTLVNTSDIIKDSDTENNFLLSPKEITDIDRIFYFYFYSHFLKYIKIRQPRVKYNKEKCKENGLKPKGFDCVKYNDIRLSYNREDKVMNFLSSTDTNELISDEEIQDLLKYLEYKTLTLEDNINTTETSTKEFINNIENKIILNSLKFKLILLILKAENKFDEVSWNSIKNNNQKFYKHKIDELFLIIDKLS